MDFKYKDCKKEMDMVNKAFIAVSYTHLDVYKRQRLDAVLGGELDEILDSLIAADQAAKLSSLNEEDA